MVFVKVRETYDLHTTRNKMTVIAIHTPKPAILKKNYPGLLMQCKAYRPVSADVRVACASVLPLDPQGIGTSPGDVAPEDVFNPILYKAMSNFGMSQLEARINALANVGTIGTDIQGDTANVDVDSVTTAEDEFPIYYGLLSNTHDWKHANPQSGLQMTNLKPLVWEMVYNVGDNAVNTGTDGSTNAAAFNNPTLPGGSLLTAAKMIRGGAKSMPFINTTAYSASGTAGTYALAGFPAPSGDSDVDEVGNAEVGVPWINVVVGAIIVPPSRLHEMFYRMVVEWTIEFSQIRPISEVTDFGGLARLGNTTHYQNYDYSETKEAITGTKDTILDSDSCMVAANVEVDKVM